jgi:hypothetical protein
MLRCRDDGGVYSFAPLPLPVVSLRVLLYAGGCYSVQTVRRCMLPVLPVCVLANGASEAAPMASCMHGLRSHVQLATPIIRPKSASQPVI